MNKIAKAFADKKAFIAYLMAGDPSLEQSAQMILTAQEAGADLIEIGIPFSDPVAEGPVIQEASERALAAGTRLDGVFAMVRSISGQMQVPMVFMTYLNPVFVYGYDRFFAECAEIGVAGVIIPDLPFEEQGEAKDSAAKHGVEIVTLVAPTSRERVALLAQQAEGFLYLVSSLGVTGMRGGVSSDVTDIVADIRQVTDLPVAVGFGVSTPEQAAHYAALADGVIVGSAIVDIVGQYGTEARQPLYDYIKGMKDAVAL